MQIDEAGRAGKEGRNRQRVVIAVDAHAQPDLRPVVQAADDGVQPRALLVSVIGAAPEGKHIAVGVKLADQGRRTVAGGSDAGRGAALPRPAQFDGLPMVVKVVEDFVEVTAVPSDVPRVVDGRAQQAGRDARHAEAKLELQRDQPADLAPGHRHNGGEESGFSPDEDTIGGDEVLVGFRIINRQIICALQSMGYKSREGHLLIPELRELASSV